MIRCADHPSPFPCPPSPKWSTATSVSARYNAPESRCDQPSLRATRDAVDDFPEAAGPSIAMTRIADPLEITEEPRVADRDGATLRQLNGGTGDRPEHAKRHRQPVIPGRLDPPSRRPVRSANEQVVAAGFSRDPQ